MNTLQAHLGGRLFDGRWLTRFLSFSLLCCIPLATVQAQAASGSTSNFVCGGSLETHVWQRWDEGGFAIAQELLEKRLIATGDVYALYDFQTYFHNLLAMAQRCQRTDRQLQMAKLVTLAYGQLTPMAGSSRAWICRGGAICNSTNRLINTEVMLDSLQFLAFASSLAQGLNQGNPTAPAHDFVGQTANIVREHLTRWNMLSERQTLRKSINAKPEDVKDGSSALFMTDKVLWQIAMFANWAGVLASQPRLLRQAEPAATAFAALQEHLALLLRFFANRTTTQIVFAPQIGKAVKLADLDAGYWRLYADNRYAGYTGSAKPVVCKPNVDKPTSFQMETGINPPAPVGDLGWDISHARRLVHFFDAIERNRAALVKVFGLAADDLPSHATMVALARQLRLRVWNQDKAKPLFTNYLNGANGWYRVAYDNGTGQCREGYPPFGLTDSFPTGGYASWGVLDADLGGLGERLYQLTQSASEPDQAFLKTYYPSLAQSAQGNNRLVTELMFWPTLIHNELRRTE